MIESPTTLTTSGQRSNNFGPSSSTNHDTATIKPVIASLHVQHKIICECYVIIGHKDYACIIRGPKPTPSSIRIKTNQFNTIHDDEPTYPPRE